MKPAVIERASRLTVAERQAEVQRLYPTGEYTMRELAELLGVGTMTVSRDVAALELPTRLRPNRSPKRRTRAYVLDVEARRARVEEMCAAGKTPTEISAELGCGRLTVHQDVHALGLGIPGPRVVELVCHSCGRRFTRPVSQTLDPNTRCPKRRAFCSMRCRNDAHPQRGRFVPCAYCGREVYRVPAELDHDHTCCSRSCTARLRGERLGLPQFVAPNWSGLARQRRLGRWAGIKAGRLGGRKRGYTDKHVTAGRELKKLDPNIGRGRLAKQLTRVGLPATQEQARAILAELKLEG
jgi:hypothetical protein